MLLGTYKHSGGKQHDHLVFIILNAEEHGLRRTEHKYYQCDCGNLLSPKELDLGDRQKQSWPDCMSWREGGQKWCPECGERFSMSQEQWVRPRGYEVVSDDEYDKISDETRESVFDQHSGDCIACDNSADAVHRIVPPRYGGSGDPTNLVPVCDEHRHRRGHVFLDILMPWEWEDVSRLDWVSYVERLRDHYSDDDSTAANRIASLCDDLLERGNPKNPNPYAKSNLGDPIEIVDIVDEDGLDPLDSVKDIIKRVGKQYPDLAGAPEQDVLVVMRDQFDIGRELASSTIEELQTKGEVYRPTDTTLKVV
jgi:hypothetical protein